MQLLANLGFDPNYGARPVKRVIQQSVENELARMVLKGELKEDDTVVVDLDLTPVSGGALPVQKLSFRKLQQLEASNLAADADSVTYAQG